MDIKTFMAIAVVALTAACSDNSAEDQLANADVTIQLNDDGSVVNNQATPAANEAAK